MTKRSPKELPKFHGTLWETAKLKADPISESMVNQVYHKAMKGMPQYQKVEELTNVPWVLVAGLHMRESSFDFTKYLGNGQPLDRVTTLVPKGRGPFPSWIAGAVDAMKLTKLDQVIYWDICKMLESAERFNGMGYFFHHGPDSKYPCLSPYLWSCTELYSCGKYSHDGKFDPTLKDRQVGIGALFLRFKKAGLLK